MLDHTMTRTLAKCGNALRMCYASASRVRGSASQISQPNFEIRHATLGARAGTTSICTSMNARARNLMSTHARGFCNTVAQALGEDTAAMSVVRKLVVDGPLPAKSVTYVPATSGRTFEAAKQPVAVLIGFLEATPRYLKRHTQLYNERGIDVLLVCPTYKNVLWPSTGRKLAQTMMEALVIVHARTLRSTVLTWHMGDMDGFSERPLVIHGFSTGGYMYGNMLLFDASSQRSSSLRNRVVAQVMDSAVDMNGVPHGISQVVAYQLSGDPHALPYLRSLIEKLIRMHLWATHRYTTVPYSESSEALHTNTIRAPSLWVYSSADMLARAEDNQAVASKWRSSGCEVEELVFDDSKHCQHLRKHPERYTAAVNTLLDKVQTLLLERSRAPTN